MGNVNEVRPKIVFFVVVPGATTLNDETNFATKLQQPLSNLRDMRTVKQVSVEATNLGVIEVTILTYNWTAVSGVEQDARAHLRRHGLEVLKDRPTERIYREPSELPTAYKVTLEGAPEVIARLRTALERFGMHPAVTVLPWDT